MSSASVTLSDSPLVPPPIGGLDRLTPAQQLALLNISRSQVAREVRAKMIASTARPSFRDYETLAKMGYACPKRVGYYYEATLLGRIHGDILARHYAPTFDIKVRIKGGLTRRVYGTCTTRQLSA